MSKKYKKICRYLNHVGHLLILALAVTGCVWISECASSVVIPVGISSSVSSKILANTAEIRKYQSIIKKRKNMII